MSEREIAQAAKAWLVAVDEEREAMATFRDSTTDVMSSYEKLRKASKDMKDRVRALFGAVRDLPNDDMGTDARIVVLRTENERLREQVHNLRREITNTRSNNETRNRELDALHYVWCDGGCRSGVHRYCKSTGDITEDVVTTAERNTKRLRTWFENRKLRDRRGDSA